MADGGVSRRGQTRKDGRVDALRRVVVVGGASDTATVLQAVFESRGATVQRLRNAQTLSADASEVIVIDLDAEQGVHSNPQPSNLQPTNPQPTPSRVLIGSRIPEAITSSERFLAKPFHYPELVKMIEELLDAKATA